MTNTPPSSSPAPYVKTTRPAEGDELAFDFRAESPGCQSSMALIALLVIAAPLAYVIAQTYNAGLPLATGLLAVPFVLTVILSIWAISDAAMTVLKRRRRQPDFEVEQFDITVNRAWVVRADFNPSDSVDLDDFETPDPTLPTPPTPLGPTLPWHVLLLELTDARLISITGTVAHAVRTPALQLASPHLRIIARPLVPGFGRVILSITTREQPTPPSPITPTLLENPRVTSWISGGLTEHQPEDLPLWILQAINRVPNADAPSTMPQ